MIHLDTSFLIGSLARHTPEDLKLRAWIAAGQPLGVSAVAWAEFLCGPVDEAAVDAIARVLGQAVAFVNDDATTVARLFNLSGRRRGTFTDCMIAAVSIRAGAALATSNPSDFRTLEPHGLKLA